MLSNVTGESTATLKELNPTRWAGRLLIVLGMMHNYYYKIIDSNKSPIKQKRRNS